MRLIFCADPWNTQQPDAMYAAEVLAGEQAGFSYSLLNFEALVDQRNVQRAMRKIEMASNKEIAYYRGWMLRPEIYAQLYQALLEKNIYLINTPAAYIHCHYFPESYTLIQGYTPRSVWLKFKLGDSIENVIALLQPFGDKPLIVKDFVKSRKHEWSEACYIPDASDSQVVERVVARFLQLQGEDLNVGLVFREFIAFEPLTQHSKSGMPLTKEYRLFFRDGQLIHATAYWDEGDYGNDHPPLALFTEVAQQVQSRFFTMDVAKCLDGSWMIVELGDGQVAGLPVQANIATFYLALATLTQL